MKLVVKPKIADEVSYHLQVDYHSGRAKDLWDHYGDTMPEVMVDVGAHIGTVGLAAACNGSKFVYCVEADLGNYQYLLANIKANKVEHRVLPLWMAVAEESFDLRTLYICQYNSGMRSLTNPYKEPEAYGPIRTSLVWTIALEDLLAPVIGKYGRIDFLKIDVEGMEYALFQDRPGLNAVIRNVKHIDIECHDYIDEEYVAIKGSTPQDAKAMEDYLRSVGFTVSSYGPHYHTLAKR